MFFTLSKLLIDFVYPLTWILALLVVALIIKNHKLKQRLLLISFILLVIFSNPFLFDNFAKSWDIETIPPKKSSPYSCVIVLGGFSSQGANQTGFFNGSCDRFIEALKLLSTHQATHILISGGNANLFPGKFKESDWVKGQLKDFNVPDSSIVVEDRSRNTIENATFSRVLLNKNHLQPPYLLVTSAFHMRRALGVFQNAKVDVVPYPCNFMTGSGHFSKDETVPDANVLAKWNIYIKEVIGLTVNHIKPNK
jgi:uncharacterized SAM-binding protein YcdF (DUF218 family)